MVTFENGRACHLLKGGQGPKWSDSLVDVVAAVVLPAVAVSSTVLKKISLFILFLMVLLPSRAFSAPADYMVLGVIASSNARAGVALVKHKESGKVSAHREGAMIEKGLVITKIHRKEVLLAHNGENYRLSVGAESAEHVSGTLASRSSGDVDATNLHEKEGIEFKDDTLRVNASLKNMLVERKLGEILMQVASEPHLENGRLVGFKLWDIEKGSIFAVAGFQDGDLITHINGQPINSAATAIRILNNLKNASDADIDFVRQNQKRQLKIMVQ